MPDFFKTYSITPLSKKHNRNSFDCGVQELNDYFVKRAGQDSRRNVASIWVAENNDAVEIAGFYSLSMAAVPLSNLSDDTKKKLPRYGNVPAVRLGRLAISRNEQGKGLGKYLLTDAIIRCLRDEIAWALFLVDAKNDTARKFYENFGFFSLKENKNNLYIPRTVIEREYSFDE